MIEHVFHQIWINQAKPQLPDRFKRFRDTWLNHHPSWDYRLWNLDNLDFEPRCAALLPQCQHPAQMADLLRMEILHQHGGIYLDTDFECLRPLDAILGGVSFFSCSEDGKFISTGILGARRHAALLDVVIKSFPEHLGCRPVNVETGPAFFTEILLRNGFHNSVTLFPAHYFYPFNYHTRNRASIDLSQSFAVHHYADSWKTPTSPWRRALNRAKHLL